MVFVSFPGFGLTPPPTKPYTIFDYAEDIKELIIKIAKGKSVDIVCHSFGGRVATILAVKYPELVNSLFFIDVAGVKPRRRISYYIKIYHYKRVKKLVEKGKAPRESLNKFGSDDFRALDGIMKQTFVNVVNQHLTNYYKDIKCPTFLFWGKRDKDTPLYMAKFIKRKVKESKLLVVKNAGHFSYLDNIELFMEKLENFLIENN